MAIPFKYICSKVTRCYQLIISKGYSYCCFVAPFIDAMFLVFLTLDESHNLAIYKTDS